MTDSETADHIAIAQVIQLYFDALDEKDYARLELVFTADAVLRYSLDESTGPAVSPAAMAARMRSFNAAFRFTQHLSGPPAIETQGDEARARTNLRALHVQQRRDGSTSTWTVRGVYWDRLARTACGWRIVERIFRAVHVEGELLGGDDVVRYERPPWRALDTRP